MIGAIEDIFSRLKRKAQETFVPFRESVAHVVRSSLEREKNRAKNQADLSVLLQPPTVGRAIATDLEPTLSSLAQKINDVVPSSSTPLTDILKKTTGMGVGDVIKTGINFFVPPYSKDEQSLYKKLYSQNPVFTPEERKAAQQLSQEQLLDTGLSLLSAVPKITPLKKQIPKTADAIDDVVSSVKKQIGNISEKIPSRNRMESTFTSLRDILSSMKERGIEGKSLHAPSTFVSTINKADEEKRIAFVLDKYKKLPRLQETVKKLLSEGYRPSWIDNILSRAKQDVFDDAAYAYNYVKKVAKNQNLEPLSAISSLVQPSSKSVQSILGKTMPRIDEYEKLLQSAKTADDVSVLQKKGDELLQAIEASLQKKGKPFETLVDELEKNIDNEDTRQLRNWLTIHKARAESDLQKIFGDIEGYFPHYKKERIDELLKEALPDTFETALTKPFFSYRRTGALKEYEKSIRALRAYQRDAIRNIGLSLEQKKELDAAQKIVNSIKTNTPVDVVSVIQSAVPPSQPKNVFTKESSSIANAFHTLFRSVNDRARLAGDDFYDAFLYPFRKADINTQKAIADLSNRSKDELAKMYPHLASLDKESLLTKVILEKRQKEMDTAISLFKKNIANSDIQSPALKMLVNDIFKTYVVLPIKTQTVADKALGIIRAQAGRGALGFNIASAINNLFETKRIVSTVKEENALRGLRRVFQGEDFLAKYGVSSTLSTVLERTNARKGIGKILQTIDDGLFFLFDKTETLKDQIMLAVLEEQGIKKGLSGEDLTKFVIKKFDQFGIKYGKGNDIGLYQNKLFKTFFQFAQYPIKDLVLFGDKISGATKKDKGDIAYLAKYATAAVMQMLFFKAVLGRIGFGDQTGTPLDFLTSVAEGRIPVSPFVHALLTFGDIVKDELTNAPIDEYEKQQKRTALERALVIGTVPASNQLYYKTGKSIEAILKGSQEKFGGTIANPVSDDPLSIGKSLLFGPSYDPLRMRYIDDRNRYKTAGLSTIESAIFRELPRDQQKDFYEYARQQAIEKEKQAKTVAPSFIKEDKYPETKEEKQRHRQMVLTAMNLRVPVPKKDIQAALFGNRSAKSPLLDERTKVYRTLRQYIEDDGYTNEQKQAIMDAVSADPQRVSYYLLAAKDDAAKLQYLLPTVNNLTGDEKLLFLMKARETVGGKQLLSNTMITYLYDTGILSPQEKTLLQSLKYDEISNEFYFTRSFLQKNMSGKTKEKRITEKQMQRMLQIRIPSLKRLARFSWNLPQTQTFQSTIIENIRKKRV